MDCTKHTGFILDTLWMCPIKAIWLISNRAVSRETKLYTTIHCIILIYNIIHIQCNIWSGPRSFIRMANTRLLIVVSTTSIYARRITWDIHRTIYGIAPYNLLLSISQIYNNCGITLNLISTFYTKTCSCIYR